MPTIVITQPVTNSGIPGTIFTNINVPYNVTTVIDSGIGGDNTSIKWLYTIKDYTDNTTISGEVFAQHSFGTNVTWNWYGLIGDTNTMKHKVTVGLVILGGGSFSLDLRVENNDTNGNGWIANVVRIQLL